MSNRLTPPEIDARSQLVRALKEQVTRLERARSPDGEGGVVSSGCPALDLALPEGGFRRGTLVEWLTGGHGAGRETLALSTAREACREGGAVVVVDRAKELYPPAVARLGIELDQLIVVCPGNRADDVWALDQSLRCPAVAAVLAWPEKLDGHTFRRLQLAAEQGGGVGLLLRPERVRSEPSWAEVRLLVEPLSSAAPGARRRLKIDILRCPGRMRGGAWKWKSTMKRLLSIGLPRWPVQRIRAARPELDGKPIVLAEADRGGQRVRVCSREAMDLGVAVGMPLAEAAALAGGATLALEAYDPAADREALEALAVSAGRFSPLVGLDDSPAPDSLLLDITGLAHLFGGERPLAEAVADDFCRRGFAVCVAVADTVGAAWAVAHFGNGRDQAVTIIPPGETLSALRPLPVEALRIPGDVIDLLRQLGIFQVGQLERLPREDLTLRFGPRLIERWDQAVGRLAEPVVAHRPPPELRVEHVLENPTARRETIEHVVEQLVAQLCRMLVGRGRGVLRLDCRLDCRAAPGVDLSVGLFQPTASPRHLFELVRMRLERAAFAAPVSAVCVEAAVTAPFERCQEELFAGGRNSKRLRQLAGLVDRLAGRLGRASVLRPRLIADAQPERAYRYDSLVAVSPLRRPRRARSGKRAPVDVPPRPLRLVGRPVPLSAVAIMPDGPPLRFQFQGRRHRIVRVRGPERIETGWWHSRAIRRDYYRVETSTGHRYWLFRRLNDGGWFLHGTFE